MSKLRADEFVNSDDNGAPSFPHSATVPAPTADNHFATKLYTDTTASTAPISITNTISNTAPLNPSVGDFWTNTSSNIISLNIWSGISWVNAKNSPELNAGQIVTPPTISDPNGGYIPTMLTATSAVVSDATLSSSKWYKDGVEIPGATGLQYYATDTGTYKYEEIWVDIFGTQLLPSLSAVIDARAGVIDTQPTIVSSNGVYSPTTLTATAAVVSNATLVGSKWYKDGVEVPGETGLSINILAHEGGIYKYEETWTDHFGTQLLPTLSASVQVFATIADPTVLTPVDGAGIDPDFDYTAESSAITSIATIQEGFNFGGDLPARDSGSGRPWTDSAYSPTLGRVVVISSEASPNSNGPSGGVAYSDDDGETWTHASVGSDIGSGGDWVSIVWGGDKFVIQGTAPMNGSTYTPIRYSSDGINWTNANVPTGHGYGMAMAYGGGKYVVVPNNNSYNGASAGYGLYSSDGINWSTNYMGNTYWNTVTYGDGKFVACAYSTNDNPTGSNIAYSTNGGSSWSYTSAYNTLNWMTIGYGDGKFIALNHDWHSSHYTNDTSGIDGLKMMYSTNGTSWNVSGTSGINGFENSSIWRDIEYADGLWVAVASNSEPNGTKQLGYSTDGLNWTLREPYDGTKTNNLQLYSVVKTENRWIAPVRGNGVTIYDGSSSGNKPLVSDDGMDWGSVTQLTLTDTTVSKVSDGSLIGGTSIDQVLTVGETVRADTAVTSTVNDTVFSTTLYTGNGFDSNNNYLAIDTGIDNTHKSLIWIKNRDTTSFPQLFDNLRGPENYLKSSSDTQNQSGNYSLMSFTSNGFETSYNGGTNGPNERHVAWNFRAAPGFFDVVSYTGDGTGSQNISHDLGTTPGLIIVKRTDTTGDWWVYHSGLNAIGTASVNDQLKLNTTDAAGVGSFRFGQIGVGLDINSSSFTVGGDDFGPLDLNQSGATYIAYVFADDTPGLIKCGSYSSSGEVVNLGFRPQWIMIKSVDNTAAYTGDWRIYDTARGIVSGDGDASLYANEERVENTNIGASAITVNENGFTVEGQGAYGTSTIYIAIAESAEADVIENIYATGEVSASSGNTITLSDVSGTWSTGMKVRGTTTDFYDSPNAISPSTLSLTSSEPAVTQGSVITWGNAQWQVAEDSGFTTNVQSLTSALTSSGTQTGPTGFTLDYNKNYYVRTKYGSSNPAGVLSNWSVASLFKTGPLPLYADDLFSTSFYTGNGGTNNIVNGIDLAGEGGLVWNKDRTYGSHNSLWDTERGATKFVSSNQSNRELEYSNSLTSFNSDGFSLGSYHIPNRTVDYVSWAFRKAPGFFDVQTWEGNGVPGRAISHNLGSEPGMIMIKRLDASSDWVVWHRSLDNSGSFYEELSLNTTAAASASGGRFPTTEPTDTEFYVNQYNPVNTTGGTYVAYIFAHDDQSFGTSGNESIIKCGSWTTDSSTGDIPEVDLGWEPQFMIWKSATTTSDWYISDTARGWFGGSTIGGGSFNWLRANKDSIESHASGGATNNASGPLLTSTGFVGDGANWGTNETYIYMAIRRPHKPATSATEVFAIDNGSGSSTIPTWDSGFPVDMSLFFSTFGGYNRTIATRMTGVNYLSANSNSAQATDGSLAWDSNVGWGKDYNQNFYSYMFRRAPGFMDVVTYKGTGNVMTVNHNLGAVPELILVKSTNSTHPWYVYNATSGSTKLLELSTHQPAYNASWTWNNTTPTSTQFTVGDSAAVVGNIGANDPHVAYLFASLDGISKVGSYTGTGGNVDVDCGFAAGARFILIKRTDTNGDWYIWDTARGVTGGNDPYTLLNSTEAQVTNTDYIDPLNAGFTVTSSAPADINASGGQYLFLAIA